MSKPGWYPDPSGQPGQYRWWDGVQWTPTVTADPAHSAARASGPLPMTERTDPYAATDFEARRSGIGPVLVLGLVALLFVALIAGVIAILGGGLPNPFGDRAASNPTAAVCPRPTVETASPTPRSRVPGRVRGGALSYPQLGAPWGPVEPETRVPFGRDVSGQNVMLHDNYDGRGSSWVASVVVGELVAGDGFFSPQQGSEIITRCVLGVFYGDAEVHRTDVRNEAIQVDGHDAWVVEMHLDFQIRGLDETGETAIIVVADTGEESASLWYASIPDSRPDLLAQARQLQQQLRVEG